MKHFNPAFSNVHPCGYPSFQVHGIIFGASCVAGYGIVIRSGWFSFNFHPKECGSHSFSLHQIWYFSSLGSQI